jgi:hypothetical protein
MAIVVVLVVAVVLVLGEMVVKKAVEITNPFLFSC